MYDSIGSGYRQRFSILQKSDLMAWYNENIKLDICKEVKTALDAANGNENEIPDGLMAKLIKSRLLVLKQEGIDARAAARALAETPTTPVAVEAPKGGAKAAPAKDDKKDRAKSPGKKPTGKGADKKGGVPEPVSRPESASPAEISKRKNKLREKAGKTESKIQAIDDEPADGPDAYILLKDFTNMGVLNALMEENEIQIHNIFRLTYPDEPSTPSSPAIEIKTLDSASVADLATTNRVLVEAREWCVSANDDSLWRNIAWNSIRFSSSNFEPKEVFDAIALKLYVQLKLRREFKEYYSQEKVVTIPSIVDVNTLKNELRSLGNLFDVMPTRAFLSLEVILGILAEQSVRFLKTEEDTDVASGMDPVSVGIIDEMGHLVNYLERTLKKISLNQGSTASLAENDENLKTNRIGDVLTHSKIILGDLNAFGINVSELITSVQDIYPTIKLQESLRQGRPNSLTDASILRQRVANMAELRKSTACHFNEALRVLLQNQMEDMLGGGALNGVAWNLNEWSWAESLDKSSMAQVIQEAKISHPVIKTKFCEKTGKLLIALSGYGGVGTNIYDGNSHIQVKTKVNFGLFHELNDRFKSHLALPPKNKTENRPSVYYSGDSVIDENDDYTVLYPSDGGHITVHREQHLNYKPDIRTNLFSDGNSITWASASQSKSGPYITAALENNIVFSALDKDGARIVSLSCPDGLIIEFKQNGNITLKYDTTFSTSTNENPIRGQSAKELSRVIMSDGTTIRLLNNSTTEVLLPDGTTSINNKGLWTTTGNDGTRIQTTVLGESTELSPVRFAKETIIALSEVIITREDLVVTTTKKDGTTIAEHADGTVIHTQTVGEGIPSIITIEKPETPKFTIKDNGAKVLIRLLDGTTVEQTDGSNYRIFNDIHTFEFESLATGESKLTVLHSKRLTTGSHVDYAFNWLNGTFDSTDSAGTRYTISSTGDPEVTTKNEATQPAGPTEVGSITVDASGNFVKRLLESPLSRPLTSPNNPPKLFIVEDDGSGIQLLRDVDLIHFFKDQLRNPNTEVLEDPVLGDGTGLFVTVIGRSTVDPKKHNSGDMVFYRQVCGVRTSKVKLKKTMTLKLLKYPIMNAATRQQINADLVKFESIITKMKEQKSDAEERNVQELRDYDNEAEGIVLGQNRLRTQEEILNMYKLHKQEFGSRPHPVSKRDGDGGEKKKQQQHNIRQSRVAEPSV
ncbi:UNVERIFIED_CONTAM: Sperm-associated antigen 17 [Siphonaria sp. JEL0065]|nr:Sperm-associated antigen 17 [Siphonaria sp. JEL0065]